MSVRSLIDQMLPYSGESSRTRLLALIAEGQDEILNSNGTGLVYRDPLNLGFPPYLITVAGTVSYEIIAANLSCGQPVMRMGATDYAVRATRVMKVFVDAQKADYDYGRRWMGKPYIIYNPNPYGSAQDRVVVADVPVKSHAALEGTPCRVMFPEDPGASTQKYFVQFTIEAPRLLSESIPLALPKRFEPALRAYVMGTLQTLQHGRRSELLAEFYDVWVPKYQQEEDALGAEIETLETPTRMC